ncbi:hypothetical protein JW933_10670 [candidate division FCPU426 bacterium]|nr:hypothetical protein [candidate division FCPU426 bacterium]
MKKYHLQYNLVILVCALSAVGGMQLSAWPAFELERPGARPASMGGAFCAVADDADAMMYNPAGLGKTDASVLSFNYIRLLTGLNDGSLADSRLAFMQPIESVGTFGGVWYQRNLANLYQENIFKLSCGLGLDEAGKYYAGTSVSLFQQNFLDETAQAVNPFFAREGTSQLGFAIDLGGLAYISDGLCAGVALANINQPNMALDDSSAVVPLKIRLGGAYQHAPFLGTAEVLFYEDHYRFAAGGEAWWFKNIVATRAGIGMGDKGLLEISAGLSLRLQQNSWAGQIDYAFVNPLGDFAGVGGTHQFNLTLILGAEFVPVEVQEAREKIAAGERALQAGQREQALEAWDEAAEVLGDDEQLVMRISALRKEVHRIREAELLVKRGLDFEKEGNLLNAAASYRKALKMWPEDLQAAQLLADIDAKIRRMTEKQKKLQEQKERRMAQWIRQQNQTRAEQAVKKAEQALEQIRANAGVAKAFPKDIREFEEQLAESRRALAKDEYDEAILVGQSIVKETGKLEQRLRRVEAAKRRKASRTPATAPPVTAAPAVVAKPAVLAGSAEAKPDAEAEKMRKRARGAYGRAVKLMLDIGKAKGNKYFPGRMKESRKALAKLKALLNEEKYTETISAAEKLYPKLEKLKQDCEAEEKARQLMPTNW